MAVQISGLSTLGVKLGYAVETQKGVKPSAFKWLERCNSIGGIEMPVEQIDASALEDLVTRYIPGRQDSGGEWSCSFNITPEVEARLSKMIEESSAGKLAELNTWFEVWSPSTNKAYFVKAQPPKVLPMPETGQNDLWTIDVTLSIDEYKGLDEAIEPQSFDPEALG